MAIVPSGKAQPPVNDPPLQAERFSRAWLDFFQQLSSQAAAAAGGDLPLAGGTMHGALILAGAPTAALQAATKAYVDAAAVKSTFVYTQPSAASVWTVPHNLGVYPSVVVADSAGTFVEGDIHYDNLNTVTLTFAAPFSGTAYCV